MGGGVGGVRGVAIDVDNRGARMLVLSKFRGAVRVLLPPVRDV